MMQASAARPIFKVFRVGLSNPNANSIEPLSKKENTEKSSSSLLLGTPHVPPQFQKYSQNNGPFGSPYIMTTIDYMASIYQYIVYLGWVIFQSQTNNVGTPSIRNILVDCKELLKQLEYAKLHVTDEREKEMYNCCMNKLSSVSTELHALTLKLAKEVPTSAA